MKQERKERNYNELFCVYVPRFTVGLGLDECEALSIQDLCYLYRESGKALDACVFEIADGTVMILRTDEEKKTLADSRDKVAQLIFKKILEAKELYVLFDKPTRMPQFTANGFLSLYSEQEFAEEALQFDITSLHRDSEIRKIDGNVRETLSKYIYRDGALGFVMDDGQAYFAFGAGELSSRGLDAPAELKAGRVASPLFVRALSMLEQERLWNVDYPAREKKLEGLANALGTAFRQSYFLVPIVSEGSEDIFDENCQCGDPKKIMDAGEKCRIPYLMPAGAKTAAQDTIPAFTDWDQMEKMFPGQRMFGWIWGPQTFAAAAGKKVVFNPATASCAVNVDDLLRNMK